MPEPERSHVVPVLERVSALILLLQQTPMKKAADRNWGYKIQKKQLLCAKNSRDADELKRQNTSGG